MGVCFLLLHHLTRPDCPLVLLANRDEYFDRPFDPPTRRDDGFGIWAPRDRRAGGTWLGVNRHGLAVAITNRGSRSFDGLRSRGALVLDTLRHTDAEQARAFVLGHLATTAYAGFNLLMADGVSAWVVRHPGAAAPRPVRAEAVVSLAPGAHVLTNLHDLDQVPVPDLGRPRPEAALAVTLAALRELAADDQTVLPGNHRILKRAPNRGTVCSALLACGPGTSLPIFEFAGGVPGEVPFRAVARG